MRMRATEGEGDHLCSGLFRYGFLRNVFCSGFDRCTVLSTLVRCCQLAKGREALDQLVLRLRDDGTTKAKPE